MALDAAAYKILIVAEVGDSASEIVQTNIDTIWEMHDGETRLHRQYLLVKRKAIDLLMGSVREQVTQTSANNQTTLTDKMRNLKTMRDDVTAELQSDADAADAAVTNNRGARLGQLTTTTPAETPSGYPDANAAYLRGDPWGRR